MQQESLKICPHLAPYLQELQARGNKLIAAYADGWSNCEASFVLDSGPTFAQTTRQWNLTQTTNEAGVKAWFCDDSHYDIENGLFCETCKHALSWPRDKNEARPAE